MIHATLILTTMLAWRPFLEPLNPHGQWASLLLMPPLIVAVSLVYKTLKLPTLQRLVIETIAMSLYILIFMIAAAVVLYVVVDYIIA